MLVGVKVVVLVGEAVGEAVGVDVLVLRGVNVNVDVVVGV